MMINTMNREELESKLTHVEFRETRYADMAAEIERGSMFDEAGVDDPKLEEKYWEYVNKAEECYNKKMELIELLNNM